jgi:hypothetical protein
MIDAAKVVDYDTAVAHKSTRPPKPPTAKPLPPQSPKVAAPLESTAGYLLLKLADVSNQELLHDIKNILSAHQGEADTFMLLGIAKPKKIRLPFKVTVSDALVAELGELLGTDSVSRAA